LLYAVPSRGCAFDAWQNYRVVFAKLKELAPDFTPVQAISEYEQASVSGLLDVYGDVAVAGCWFHYAQAVVKRLSETRSTRQLSYREEDRAMRPIYGCTEKF